MFNASSFNSATYNSGSTRPNLKTQIVSDILLVLERLYYPQVFHKFIDVIKTSDHLLIRLNGKLTALWTRIARQPITGITKIAKDAGTGWTGTAKDAGGMTKIAKDAGVWTPQPKDQ